MSSFAHLSIFLLVITLSVVFAVRTSEVGLSELPWLNVCTQSSIMADSWEWEGALMVSRA